MFSVISAISLSSLLQEASKLRSWLAMMEPTSGSSLLSRMTFGYSMRGSPSASADSLATMLSSLQPLRKTWRSLTRAVVSSRRTSGWLTFT